VIFSAVWIFATESRPNHLDNMIDRHRLNTTHMTERVGSPQTLVCAKDRRTLDRRMKKHHDEIAAMRNACRQAGDAGDVRLQTPS